MFSPNETGEFPREGSSRDISFPRENARPVRIMTEGGAHAAEVRSAVETDAEKTKTTEDVTETTDADAAENATDKTTDSGTEVGSAIIDVDQFLDLMLELL